MKKLVIILLTCLPLLAPVGAEASHISRAEVYTYAPNGLMQDETPNWIVQLIKTVTDQVLKAMNLALMRLQNENMDLTNAAKLIESTIHSEGLQNVVNAGKEMKDLYEKYYDDLRIVKDAIVTIATLKNMVETERALFQDYLAILDMVNKYSVFSPKEVDYIVKASQTVFENAVINIEEIQGVTTSFKTDMTDAERLTLIKQINARIEQDRRTIQVLKGEITRVVIFRIAPENGDNLRNLFYND